MRRRWYFWIGGIVLLAALAVGLAVASRSDRFAFLEHAKVIGSGTVTLGSRGGEVQFRITTYEVSKPLHSVVAEAKRELTVERGWDWRESVWDDGTVEYEGLNSELDIKFSVFSQAAVFDEEPLIRPNPDVSEVHYRRQAHALDRLLDRIFGDDR